MSGRALFAPLFACLLLGCVSNQVRDGQRLFAGCVDGVNDSATLRTGRFVCDGPREERPFDGNGRSCGDCHVPGDNFGISLERIRDLPHNDPFFFPGLDEDQELLREHGLVRVVVAGEIDEFRPTPKLVHLRALCDDDGNCDVLGQRGDRVRNLCVFSIQALGNHMAKTLDRIPGRDFRVPTTDECEALTAYMLSDLVSGQDERNR